MTVTSFAGSPHLERLSLDEYRAFFARPDVGPRTLYHDPRWLETVQDGLGFEVAILALRSSGELVGALPGFVSSKFGLRLFGSPLRGSMTPYLGWIFRQPPAADLSALLGETFRYCRRALRCQYAELGFFQPPAGISAAAARSGWKLAERETYLLDLRPGESALWAGLGRHGRSSVRKAERSGVTVESSTDRALVDVYFPMIEGAYARHNAVSPHPKRFYLSLYDRLVPHGLMEVFVAKVEGRVVGAAIVLHDGQDARLMSMASLPEFHPRCPNNGLQWHIISWACRQGLLRYDLGGKGHPGINRFKESFGPSPYAYTLCWNGSPPAALARRIVLKAWPGLQWCRHRLRRLAEWRAERLHASIPLEHS